jgi:hypothetical protein
MPVLDNLKEGYSALIIKGLKAKVIDNQKILKAGPLPELGQANRPFDLSGFPGEDGAGAYGPHPEDHVVLPPWVYAAGHRYGAVVVDLPEAAGAQRELLHLILSGGGGGPRHHHGDLGKHGDLGLYLLPGRSGDWVGRGLHGG